MASKDSQLCVCANRNDLFDMQWILSCRCHEERLPSLDWTWNAQSEHNGIVCLTEKKSTITFHPLISHGTAVVWGGKPLSHGIHYWEVKALSPIYGTDVIVGAGTSDSKVPYYIPEFRSVVGCDHRSWGLSYRGYVFNSGQQTPVSPLIFQRGSVVGCLLDLVHGTLRFFVDRRSHPMAVFRHLPKSTYYPMVSSTAGRVGFRLIRTEKFEPSLQLLACRAIRQALPHDQFNFITIFYSLPPPLQEHLTTQLPWCLYLNDLLYPVKSESPTNEPDCVQPETVSNNSDSFLWTSFDEPDIRSTLNNSPDLFEDLDSSPSEQNSSHSDVNSGFGSPHFQLY